LLVSESYTRAGCVVVGKSVIFHRRRCTKVKWNRKRHVVADGPPPSLLRQLRRHVVDVRHPLRKCDGPLSRRTPEGGVAGEGRPFFIFTLIIFLPPQVKST